MTERSHTPEWVKHAIFYQIFPDRFARSEEVYKPAQLEPWGSPVTRFGFKGGDLVGVCDKLDYLQDLGITALYFNPIFTSTANHRYHPYDFYQVDPLLGGNAAFYRLLKEAHRRNMRIILDGVFNHASRGFFQFNHILENGEKSPYLDWFKVYGFPMNAYQGKPNYACWWNLPALPQFNIDHPPVREYLLGVARYWIEEGVDGWRLDVPFEIRDEHFWRQFRTITKDANPDAYLVGEIPSEAQEWLQGDKFDGVMNYQWTAACVGFFGAEHRDDTLVCGMMGFDQVPHLDAEGFLQRITELLELYPRQNALAQLNLLDSHDMPRFLSMVNENAAILKLAILFQMTYPGAPCIYYGDEIGMLGGRDPDNRRTFPWNKANWNMDLHSAVQQYTHLRSAHPALRTGEFIPLVGRNRSLAYLRYLEDEQILVALHAGENTEELVIPLHGHLPDGSRLKDLLGGEEVVVEQGQINTLKLAPWQGFVYRVVP